MSHTNYEQRATTVPKIASSSASTRPPTDRITAQTRQTLVIFATYTGGGTMGRKFAGHYLILSHNRHLLQGPMRTPEEIVIKVMIDTNMIGTTTVTKNGTQTKHMDVTETNQEAVTMRTADQMTMSEIGEMNTQGTVIQDRTMTRDHLQTQGECITRVINPTKSQNVTCPNT